MKRTDLVRRALKAGSVFVRHGRKHDIYEKDGEPIKIPRHKEINERLAKSIIRKHGL